MSGMKQLPTLLTSREVTQILKVHKATLIQWEKRGILKPIHFGKTIRYTEDEIRRALQLPEAIPA